MYHGRWEQFTASRAFFLQSQHQEPGALSGWMKNCQNRHCDGVEPGSLNCNHNAAGNGFGQRSDWTTISKQVWVYCDSCISGMNKKHKNILQSTFVKHWECHNCHEQLEIPLKLCSLCSQVPLYSNFSNVYSKHKKDSGFCAFGATRTNNLQPDDSQVLSDGQPVVVWLCQPALPSSVPSSRAIQAVRQQQVFTSAVTVLQPEKQDISQWESIQTAVGGHLGLDGTWMALAIQACHPSVPSKVSNIKAAGCGSFIQVVRVRARNPISIEDFPSALRRITIDFPDNFCNGLWRWVGGINYTTI